MGVFLRGQEYTKVYMGGREFDAVHFAGNNYLPDAPVDQPGTLSVRAVRASRGATIDYSISDPNGIRAVTAVIMLAGDGTRSDVTSQIARTDRNTFAGSSRRLNNKWRVARITITYTDATSGASHTLTQSWSL